MRALLLAGILTLAASPCFAGSDFAVYDGPAALQQGSGGTKIVTDGVDFWTSGAPPHRYRILGMLTDKRGTGLFSGKAVGSSGVARRIRALGGDAAILVGANATVTGGMMLSNGVFAVARRAQTQFLVVRYEDQGAPSPIAGTSP